MPVGFIIISILILFLLFYRNTKVTSMPKILFITILFSVLVGYFVNPIIINDFISLNVFFMFAVLFMGVEFFLSLKTKTKMFVLGVVIINVLIYYVLTVINNDFVSFLNYIPIALIITISSGLFLNNYSAGFSVILISFLAVELINYIIFKSLIGFLEVANVELINYIVYSLLAFFVVNKLFIYIIKNLFSSKVEKVVEYEN